MSAISIVITGVSGGLGASTLTGALARGLAELSSPVVALDLDTMGGGLDVTCGIEHLEGFRWSDLRSVEGSVSPPSLLQSLPGPHEVKVLSAGGPGGGPGGGPCSAAADREGALADVIGSVAATGRIIVTDLPKRDAFDLRAGALWSLMRPTLWLLLVGTTTRGLADLDAFLTSLDRAGGAPTDALAVVLAGPDQPRERGFGEALAQHTGLPVIGQVPWRRSVARGAERGEWPSGGAHEGVLREILRRLPEVRVA